MAISAISNFSVMSIVLRHLVKNPIGYLFLDADEFICLKNDNDINYWIKRFDKYPAITISFLMFGTSGVIKHDYSRMVIEQYTQCWNHYYHVGKCFINTRYQISDFGLWHLHHHTYMKYPFLFLS